LKLKSAFFFTAIFGLVLLLHLYVLFFFKVPVTQNQLFLSYAANFFLAGSILWGLFIVFKKNSSQVGFLFMASSLLKFILFFMVFYPMYKVDGNLEKDEVLTFLIPYFTGLFLESFILVRKLNKI
jgi:hypothetical protein